MSAPMQLVLFRGAPTLRTQLGLQPAPPGAERLLAALIRHGLQPDAHLAAARLCIALEREAAGHDEEDTP